jgi:hypothetical protein
MRLSDARSHWRKTKPLYLNHRSPLWRSNYVAKLKRTSEKTNAKTKPKHMKKYCLLISMRSQSPNPHHGGSHETGDTTILATCSHLGTANL